MVRTTRVKMATMKWELGRCAPSAAVQASVRVARAIQAMLIPGAGAAAVLCLYAFVSCWVYSPLLFRCALEMVQECTARHLHRVESWHMDGSNTADCVVVGTLTLHTWNAVVPWQAAPPTTGPATRCARCNAGPFCHLYFDAAVSGCPACSQFNTLGGYSQMPRSCSPDVSVCFWSSSLPLPALSPQPRPSYNVPLPMPALFPQPHPSYNVPLPMPALFPQPRPSYNVALTMSVPFYPKTAVWQPHLQIEQLRAADHFGPFSLQRDAAARAVEILLRQVECRRIHSG